MRVGLGYDIHRLTEGRQLVLGGIVVPYELGEEGFSDGDALIHALIDALLGAAGLDDIGAHFPDGQDEYRGISSRILLKRTRSLLEECGCEITNVDCTVIIERPKIRPYADRIRRTLAGDLRVCEHAVSVKAKTKEGFGPVGSGEAVEAYAVALVRKNCEHLS